MNPQIIVGALIALGLMGAWNTWTLYQVNQRLDVIEQLETSQQPSKRVPQKITYNNNFTTSRMASKEDNKEINVDAIPNKVVAAQKNTEPSSIDLMDPEVQEAIAQIAENNAQKKEEQRRQSKMEAYNSSIKYELEKFSKEKEYDSETVQGIETALNESSAEWRAVREQVREGEISWIDARTEFKAIGEETKEKVTELISEEDYTELSSRLWGDWNR